METDNIADLAVDFIVNLAARGGPQEHQVTEDFSWWMSFLPGVMDVEQVKQHIVHIGMPPMVMEPIGIVHGADRVAVEIQGRCTLVDGRQYDNNYCFIFAFRGKRIAEVREYCDTKLAADMFGGLGTPVSQS